MTTYHPAYRMRVYAPRSVDATEATVLTPAAGAPHSSSFQIATIQGLAGYQGLMGIPEGRRGRFDPLSRRVEHGTIRVPLFDFRVIPGGLMSERWGTSFTGDTTGRPLPLGCLAVLEWDPSTGWGSTPTWAPYWKGPVQDWELESEQVIALVIKDMAARFNYEIGVGRPHASATSVCVPTVLPYGISADYGTLKAYGQRGQLTGKVKTNANGYRYIDVDNVSLSRPDNVVTAEMRAKMRVLTGSLPFPIGAWYTNTGGLRLRFSSSSPSISNKELQATACETVLRGNDKFAASRIYVVALDPGDPLYQAFDSGTVADNTVVSFDIRRAEEPTLFVGGASGISPVTLLGELADGYYSELKADGTPKRKVTKHTTSFAAVTAAAGRYPVRRARVSDYAERYLCQPSDLGYRFDESGELVVFSTARPTSTGSLPVITDADIFAEPAPRWGASQQGAITKYVFKGYAEHPIDVGPALKGGEAFPSLPAGGVEFEGEATQYDLIVNALGKELDLEERVHTIDCLGHRFLPGELTAATERALWIRDDQARLASQYLPMFSEGGPQRLRFRARRTANTTGVYPGGWALVNLALPLNPGTNRRGGQRLMMCTDRSEQELAIDFELIDAGAGVLANAPTLGTAPAQEGGNTKYGLTIGVTLNGQSDPVELWVNATATSVGSRPADADAGWHLVQPASKAGTSEFRVTATGTQTVHPLPAGKRLWVRARSAPTDKLASGWVYPTTTGYVDLAAMATPSSVAIASVTVKAGRLSWTNTDANSPVAILLGSGSSKANADASTPVHLLTLPAGSTFYDLTGLDTGYGGNTWFRPQVAYLDALGALGPAGGIAATSFQATGTAATAPTLAGIVVLRSGATTAPQPLSNPAIIPAPGFYGTEVELVPGPAGYGYSVELRSGTTSGALALLDTVPADQVQGRGYVYRHALPPDDTTRYYDGRLVGPGVLPGAYCAEASAKPGWLTNLAFGVSQGEPVLGVAVPIHIPGPAFRPMTPADFANITYFYGSDARVAVAGSGLTVTLQAPVKCPEGATLTSFVTAMDEGSTGGSVSCKLYKDGTVLVTHTTLSGTPQETALAQLVAGETYWLWLQMTTTTLNQVWIEYARVYFKPSRYVQQ